MLAGDHMTALDGLSLGGERVRHIPQPGARGVQLRAFPAGLAPISKAHRRVLLVLIDGQHLAAGAVGNRPQLWVHAGGAQHDLIPGIQPVWPPLKRHSVLAELAVLGAQRLGARVQAIQDLVAGLHHDQGALTLPPV